MKGKTRPPKGVMVMPLFKNGEPIGHIEKAEYCCICYLIDEESVKFYEFNPRNATIVEKKDIDYRNVVNIHRNGVPIGGLDKRGYIYIYGEKTWKIRLENPKRWNIPPDKLKKHLRDITKGG